MYALCLICEIRPREHLIIGKPEYLYNKIKLSLDAYIDNIRYKGNLTLSLYKLELFKKEFIYRISRECNSEQSNIKAHMNTRTFYSKNYFNTKYFHNVQHYFARSSNSIFIPGHPFLLVW